MIFMDNTDIGKYHKSDLTRKIIACCFRVHNTLGPGFEEVIFQRALALELQMSELEFDRERWMDIRYGEKIIGKKRADFVVEDCIVEIKAKESFDSLETQIFMILKNVTDRVYRNKQNIEDSNVFLNHYHLCHPKHHRYLCFYNPFHLCS